VRRLRSIAKEKANLVQEQKARRFEEQVRVLWGVERKVELKVEC
jgi:hypothetical protein